MKAILIDAKTREVREVSIKGDLKSLQDAVGGYIELVQLGDGDDLFVNEEGLLHGEVHFFAIEGYAQPLAGNGIIVGHNGDGDTVSANLTVDWVRERVTFMTRAEVLTEIRAQEEN